MPQITDQYKLLKEYELTLISQGSTGGWAGDYLQCPICSYYVFRGDGYDACPCENIMIDSDYCRVTVKDSAECDIKCFSAVQKRLPN